MTGPACSPFNNGKEVMMITNCGIRAEDYPVVLVTVWDPFELFYNERIIETEVLNEVDSSELLTLARGKEWKTSAEIV